MQIVLARVEEDQVVVQQGRIDLGERHKFKTVAKPVSLMWVNNGTATDAAKAKEFADREGYTVFCYNGEKFPLEKARKDVLA